MKWAAIVIAVAGLLTGGATLGLAGDTTVAVKRFGPPDVEARRDALLQQMIAEPANLDLALAARSRVTFRTIIRSRVQPPVPL